MKQFATQQERIEVARALRAWRQSGNRARIVRSCHIGDTGVADDIEFSDIAGVRCIFGQARVADPSILGAVRFLSYTPLVFGLDGDGRPHVAVAPEQGGVGGMGVLHAVREVDARGTNRMTVAALAFPSVR